METDKGNFAGNTQKLTLAIKGMTCDACAISISKRFDGMEGIVDKKVNFGDEKARFTYDPARVSPEKIVNTINATKAYQVSGRVEGDGAGKSHFDLIVIGGGSAAFSAVIRANELGLSTMMVNAGLPLGGTCVNVGCVPSKNLIRAGEAAYHTTHSRFKGIKPRGSAIDFGQVIQEKKQLVSSLQQKKYVDVISDFSDFRIVDGWAEFLDSKTILVNKKDKYTALKFVIATGSTTNIPQIDGLNEMGFLTNVTLFDLEKRPGSITVMGAGYIGVELAMAYNRLGTKVRMIEFTDRVLRSQTPDISEVLESQMRQEGIELLPGYRAVRFERLDDRKLLHCKRPDGSLTTLEEEGYVVVATGIASNTKKLAVERLGLKLTATGHIQVNAKMESNVAGVYAAGDVANTPAYVYTAAYEGKIAVENAFAGAEKEADYTSLPWVVFTDPQVAGAGLDEAQAAERNIPVEVSKVSLRDVPRSLVANDTRGFIKLIRNAETDKLIGARIVAGEGGELIQQLSMAIKYGITVKQLADSFYPYLTLSEGIKLAAIAFGKDVSKLSCCAS